MPPSRLAAHAAVAVAVLLAHAVAATAADWPHLRGPAYDAVSVETGLADAWPAEGPPVLWHIEIGEGFSGFVSAAGRAYTQEQTAGGQYVVCLDADTGRRLWHCRYNWPWQPEGFWPGPMATPTVAGDRVYFVGAYGLVGCVRAGDGLLLWSRNVKEEFAGRGTEYGCAGSPLVEDGRVIVPVGGEGAAVVALDARDGSLLWRSGDWPASYTPCLPITVAGRRAIVVYLQNVVAAFDPATGVVLWSHPVSEGYDEHAAWPLYAEPYLVVARAFGDGARCLRLAARGPPEVAWETPDLSNDVCSSLVLGGRLYGFDLHDLQAHRDRAAAGRFRCLDLATGQVRWSTDRTGHASVLAADGKLILWTELGEVLLARAAAGGYEELARARVLADTVCWTAPALADGRLLVRSRTQAAAVFLGRPDRLPAGRPTSTAAAVHARSSSRRDPAAESLWKGPPLYAPTYVHMLFWFGLSMLGVLVPAALLGAAAVLAPRRLGRGRAHLAGRLVFLAAAVIFGVVGTWLLTRATRQFIFTWPVALFALYHATVAASASAPRGWSAEGRGRRWAARAAIAGLVLVCLGYAWLCRTFGIMMGYGFLAGLLPAFPVTAVAAWRMVRRPHPARDLAWTAVAFTAYFWASAVFTVWKTHR